MSNITMIPVCMLYPHPDNPRRDVGDVNELAASIKQSGVLQNLTVVRGHTMSRNEWVAMHKAEGVPAYLAQERYKKEDAWVADGFTTIIGHRRLAACKLAGITEVPCIIAEMASDEQFRTMMVENMQRSDLTPIEEADGFQMMLDMGDSVSDIAEQTGFSETTIRRRLSIGSLPKEAAKAGLEKGATLDDYLQVTKIKDPKKQEKALSTIGTADFRATVKTLLDLEKQQEYTKKLREAFQNADWLKKVEDAPYSDWEYISQFGCWCVGKFPERPADADTREYVYTERTRDSFEIRRKKVKEGMDQKEDKIRDIQKRARDELEAVTGSLKELENEFFDLRNDFIGEFGRGKRYAEEIMAMACTTLLHDDGDCLDNDEIMTFLGMGVNEAEAPGKELYRKMVMDPEKRLLVIVYHAMESSSRLPWHPMYDRDLHCNYPVFDRSESYEYMYAMLAELGYEISKEEEAYLQGACMAYTEGKAIRDKYIEEMRKVIGGRS